MTVSSDVVSFMKASSMVLSSFDSDCSEGNPRSGASRSNDGGARHRYPCGHHFWSRRRLELVLLRGNPKSGSPGSDDGDARRPSPCWGHRFWSRPWLEVWRVIFCVDNASRRLGAAESRRRTWAEMRAQGGGAVWCHGGIDGRNYGVYADIDLEDCSAVRWR
jgi:hypothetical protein